MKLKCRTICRVTVWFDVLMFRYCPAGEGMVAAFPSSLLCGINVVGSVYILSAKMNLLSMCPSLAMFLKSRGVFEDLVYILSENQRISVSPSQLI